MDAHAANLLALLKKPAAPSDAKVKELNQLKSDIKHYRVPEGAVSDIFECIRLSITQQAATTLASTAFSTLGHLLKRLKIQDASGHAITQLAPRLFPSLQERLGDLREPVRTAASQALTDLYPFCSADIENIIQNEAIGSHNARAKEAGMRWVLRMHKEEGIPFKSYVSFIVARLEDADGNVREAGKSVLIELFATAPERAKLDLKRQLKAHSVRHSIASQILSQIGDEAPTSRPQTGDRPDSRADMTGSTRSLPTIDHATHFAQSITSEAAQPPPPEIVPVDPIYVHSQRELEDVFRDMLPHFEGKETEENWKFRERSITKLHRILKGNAPTEYHTGFMVGLKSMIEGILKVANSLRTTMATNGCQLVQELAKTLGPALDPHVEMFLQSFVKMSANRKHIAAENGRQTADAIFQNCSYHVRMVQHIWNALQEKNVEQRQCTPAWLTTILRRQSNYKHNFENSGGLELTEKCIKKGLDDANPKVKEGYRATYWTFAKSWPEKAQMIIGKLDAKSKTALEKDSHNPNAAMMASQSSAAPSAAVSRSTEVASRNNMREMIAERRKAAAAGGLPTRPNSAMAEISPVKARQPTTARGQSNLSKVQNRNVSTTSNASVAPEVSGTATTSKKGSSLMSGPVRRPKRPEIQRPQTADPYASRRMLRPETPANETPLGSPSKGTGASKASMASSIAGKSGNRSAIPTASPGGSPLRRSPVLIRERPQLDNSSRPTSKGSIATNGDATIVAHEDDLTMVLPKSSTSSARGAFSPGHKRPGQTMSVDSGRTAFAEEDDGFTMVMPDMSTSQSRAQSPQVHRSPMKAMFEQAREKVGKLSPEVEKHMRIHSNGSLDDIIAAPLPPAVTSQSADVQIYEDPFTEGTAQPSAPEERKVLGELPVNENVRLHSPTQSVTSGNSPAGSPQQNMDVRMPSISTPQDRSEAMRNRKLLSSGIDRIRTRTLDAHGFRKVQDVVKSKSDIWDGGKKYDELMGGVLEYLRTFDEDPKLNQQASHKAAGLKAQALGVVRAMITVYRKDAAAWHGKALVTVLACRADVDVSSLLADLQRTADVVLQDASTPGCVDAVLDFLSASPDAGAHSVAMSLVVLRQLVVKAKSKEQDLGAERRSRLAQTAAQHLNDGDSEVRKVDVDLASELFDAFGSSKTEFWTEFQDVDENRLSLLTYYIAKKGGAVGTAP